MRAFDLTVRYGNLAAAARELHVTPSAISHQLKRLEDQLGVVLLERNGNQLSATEAGKLFQRDIADAFDRLVTAARRFNEPRDPNVVSFTTTPAFAVKWLVRRLSDFHRQHPKIELRMITTYRLVDLGLGECDLAIRFGSGTWSAPHCSRLMSDTVQPVCSPSLLTKKRGRLTPKQILDLPLIHQAIQRNDWLTWGRLHQVPELKEPAGLRFNEPLAALQGAIDGLGVVLGGGSLIQDDVVAKRLVKLAGPVAMSDAHYIVSRYPVQGRSAIAVFCQWLTETARSYEKTQPLAELTMPPLIFRNDD
jgi:LysR family glycine cleavage system transcriptional activator